MDKYHHPVRFGVSVIEMEGTVWFRIGPETLEGYVRKDIAIIMLRDYKDMETRFPGIYAEKQKQAWMIAEALTEYAAKRDLGIEAFYNVA